MDTKSFVDPVFLARFGLSRFNAIDYFLHPLNPFRSSSSSAKSSCSNEILAMQGITMGTILAGKQPPPTPQQVEEEYAAMLTRMKGEQYELLPPPPSSEEQPADVPVSPLYVIRHVLRSSPTSLQVLGIYYILEGVIYKSPPVRSLMKSTITNTVEGISQACDALSVCARYEPGFGYNWDFLASEETQLQHSTNIGRRRKRLRRILDTRPTGFERTEEEEEGIRASEAIDRILWMLMSPNDASVNDTPKK